MSFVLAALWLLVCGTLFPLLMVSRGEPLWLLVMFVAGGAGMVVFARTVRRHS